MEITDIKIKYTNDDSRMKAAVSIVFDASFAIHDIKVIEGQEKLFLAMPSKKLADGTYRDIVHPINREMRDLLESSILQAYHNGKTNSTEI